MYILFSSSRYRRYGILGLNAMKVVIAEYLFPDLYSPTFFPLGLKLIWINITDFEYQWNFSKIYDNS